jgi:flagella basal body P-ring formation protein FlgA
MNNNRPLSKRKTVQLLVILTILAWATQTLMHQWGYGAETPEVSSGTQPVDAAPAIPPETIGAEKFVPGTSSVGGTLELRGEATILGSEVKLKQICRWSDAQSPVFAPLADVVVMKMPASSPFRSISIPEVKQALHDGGINIALINFSGPASCTVTRSDSQGDEHQALRQWIDDQQVAGAKNADVSTTQPSAAVRNQANAAMQTEAAKQEKSLVRSLRELLTADVAQRLEIPLDTVQVNFSPEDDKVLALSEPYFKFDLRPIRVRNLGAVSWEVGIVTEAMTKRVTIEATARAWQNEVIVAKPLAYNKVLEDADFTERRMLVDALPDQVLLNRDQCVAQQASQDLKPGTIMTARMVDAVPLVRPGQLVTITLTQGTVQIKAVGVAMEQGALGQTIKVRNETTREVFDTTVTGPQETRLGGKTVTGNVASTGG